MRTVSRRWLTSQSISHVEKCASLSHLKTGVLDARLVLRTAILAKDMKSACARFLIFMVNMTAFATNVPSVRNHTTGSTKSTRRLLKEAPVTVDMANQNAFKLWVALIMNCEF